MSVAPTISGVGESSTNSTRHSEKLGNYPGVHVEIVLSDRFVDLLQEGIDLAIRIGRLPDSTLVARKIARVFAQWIAGPGIAKSPHHQPRHSYCRPIISVRVRQNPAFDRPIGR